MCTYKGWWLVFSNTYHKINKYLSSQENLISSLLIFKYNWIWLHCRQYADYKMFFAGVLKKKRIWQNKGVYQSYIYQVLQTIQMKLLLLWVWAEPAVLGSAKTALKFIYRI